MEIKRRIEELLNLAITSKITDIFILPKVKDYQINFRNDNCLQQQNVISTELGEEIINYFKYIAQMDISEHRRPQVGSFTYCLNDQEYYLRLSSLGDFDDQESLVIRVIYQIDCSKYFLPDQLDRLHFLTKKRGLLITSGPTGSGKTTTMYELAKKIGSDKLVMTIEDPVEVHEQTFLQTQVNNEAGIDYISLLKAALRHRPDILIIGEIRDSGTARLAIDAALSGHLVLATVHAKNTFQTISRLEGLGISNGELYNCLTAVSYQRLLPSPKGGCSCLMDIAFGKELTKNIVSKIRNNFVSWENNLSFLKQKGEISNEVYEQFAEG